MTSSSSPPRVPGNLRFFLRLGLLVIAVTFGGFGLWAALAPLDSAAVAPGKVAVEGSRKTVQHLEGGIVEAVLVTEGQRVTAGAPLVRLKDTESRARVQVLQKQLDAAEARKARLEAERDGLDTPVFPETLTSRRDDSFVARQVEGARRQFQAARTNRDARIMVHRDRITQFREEITALDAKVSASQQELASIRRELANFGQLSARGFYPEKEVRKMQRAASRLEGDIAATRAEIARTRNNINQARLNILEIEQEYPEKAGEALQELNQQIGDLAERLAVARDALTRVTLTAPVEGVVQGLQVHTRGGVIRPGDTLMEIVPENRELMVEAYVRPEDIDRVHQGQEAQVRLSAFSGRTTPVIKGTVLSVSGDRMVDSRNETEYYLARVGVPPAERALLGADQKLKPGMPAEVLVSTGERTLLQYLVKPLRDSLATSFTEE